MSDRPKATAPKAPASSTPVRRAAASKAPAAKGGSGSWLAGFITRAAAGIVYAVVFILCLVLGIVPTAIFVSVMSGLCCYEFFRMTKLDGKVANERLGIAAAVLFPLSALGDSMLLNALLFALMLAVGIWYVWSPRTRISDVAVTLMGPIYTGFMLSAIVLLRDAVPGFAGALLSVGVCASLWVSDSFAYIVGSRIGKHKMVPKISPKKSWEGFFGGILGSVLIWLILWATHFYKLSLPYALLCGVVVSILGVIGDLIESRIKRGVGVKDSGNLIPGHGGMLDRSDSLIFWLHYRAAAFDDRRRAVMSFQTTYGSDGRLRVAILGCTGSIGTQALDVCRQHGRSTAVTALSVNSSTSELVAAAREFSVPAVAVADAAHGADAVLQELPEGTELGVGAQAVCELARRDDVDCVLVAIVGAAGLEASHAALTSNKRLALANKESLVVGGDLLMPLAQPGQLIPVDSEHSAIYQCYLGENPREAHCIWLTCSGGPFFGRTRDELDCVTRADALAHPTWAMGAKITIDSATLMNKGLERIEAMHLFNCDLDFINVVVQRQSKIHSMVEFADGSVMAHLGASDMRIPIQFAFSYPERWDTPAPRIDFRELGAAHV